MESTIPSYQAQRMFSGLMTNRSAMQRTACLEQARMIEDFRVEQDYDNVKWSVMMMNFTVGNGHQFGYFIC